MKLHELAKRWMRSEKQLPRDSTVEGSQRIQKNVCFVFVQVKDDEVEHSSLLIDKALESIWTFDGTVFHVVSSIIIATFDDCDDAETRCEAAVRQLHHHLEKECRILYGTRPAVYEKLGTPTRISYGPFFRGIGDLLEQLRNLEFGAVRRLEGSAPGQKPEGI
jgi:hypothetical protein